MLTRLSNKLFALGFFVFIPFNAMATVLTPNPNGSNEEHWDAILGSGSYDEYANVMHGVPGVLLFIAAAWTIFGLFRAAFVEQSITPVDFAIYSGRFMVIIVVSIILLNSHS